MTVSDETPDYILQRINHHVFKDVELLQRNIERVTSHIRRKLAAAGADRTSTGACCASYRLATGGSTISTAKITGE